MCNSYVLANFSTWGTNMDKRMVKVSGFILLDHQVMGLQVCTIGCVWKTPFCKSGHKYGEDTRETRAPYLDT